MFTESHRVDLRIAVIERGLHGSIMQAEGRSDRVERCHSGENRAGVCGQTVRREEEGNTWKKDPGLKSGEKGSNSVTALLSENFHTLVLRFSSFFKSSSLANMVVICLIKQD